MKLIIFIITQGFGLVLYQSKRFLYVNSYQVWNRCGIKLSYSLVEFDPFKSTFRSEKGETEPRAINLGGILLPKESFQVEFLFPNKATSTEQTKSLHLLPPLPLPALALLPLVSLPLVSLCSASSPTSLTLSSFCLHLHLQQSQLP